MDRSDVISLIGVARRQDEFGVWKSEPTPREVYVQVESVTQTEFFEAGRNGLNPAFKFTMFEADYEGEPIVEYRNNQYSVYRTYLRRDNKIELYVERKGGTNKTTTSA